MNQNYSKKSLTQFAYKEEESLENFFEGIEQKEPGKLIVANVLNYSRALSVRKSKSLNHIEMVLN